MTRAFPWRPEDVTADWLNRALVWPPGEDAPGPLSQPEVIEMAGGRGQTSETVRLKVSDPTAPGGARTFVAKTASAVPHRRQLMAQMRAYAIEVSVYRSITARSRARAPFCHFGDVDDSGEQFLLLLEDFPEHRPGDEVVGLSPADARLAVEQMAHLHGGFWGDDASAGVIRQLRDEPPQLPRERLVAGWEVMVETFGDHIPQPFLAHRDAYFESAAALNAWVATGRTTVTHGDFKLDNLLFGAPDGPPGERLVLLDWQSVCIAKGIRDFAYLVSQSMSVADRREHEEGLLRRYLDGVREYGIDYDIDEAWRDYRLSMVGLIQIVVWITGVHVNPHARAALRKSALVERAFTAILDHRAFDLVATI